MRIVALIGSGLALAGCGTTRDSPNTVHGLQVVAIETVPAEPGPFDGLTLRAWVADAQDRGADTLIWLCTPVDGRCVEATPPGSTGLPLSLWVRAGRASPAFETTTRWPLFASIAAAHVELPEDVRGKLLVWALACAPGVCPVIDRVAADPLSGSDAWHQVVDDLSDPAAWIGELPRHQVSLAVKVVPVDLGPVGSEPTDRPDGDWGYGPPDTGTSGWPNQAPRVVPAPGYPDGGVRVLEVTDSDGDELSTRSFVTAGGVHHEQRGTELWVMHQEPVVPGREGVLYVVVEDGRGGTGVWTDHPAFDPCSQPAAATVGHDDGAPLAMVPRNGVYQVEVPWSLRSSAATAQWTVEIEVGGQRWRTDSSGLRPVDGCTLAESTLLRVPAVSDEVAACAVLGQIATVRVDATTYDGVAQQDHEAVVRGVLVPGTATFERACREL